MPRSLLIVLLLLLCVAQAHAQNGVVRGPDTVTVRSDGLTLRGLLWRPAGSGPFPAVLFNHGSGRNDDPRRPALLGTAFAQHGYLFLYLYRRGNGLSAAAGENSAQLMARARAANGLDARNEVQMKLLDVELRDVIAGRNFLAALPDVDASRIAVAGHSFGAQLTLLMAGRDSTIRAAVAFAPAAASWEGSPPLQERLKAAVRNARAPVFLIHAVNDISVAPGRALAAEMQRAGRPAQLKNYPAVGRTPAEGHDFVHRAVSTWSADVFPFLAAQMRGSAHRLDDATQLVVVTTTGWDSITGTLHRYTRSNARAAWRRVGRPVPIVVGKTGVAWGVGFDRFARAGEPHKREGDGRSPAGIFPVHTTFGFAPAGAMKWRMPYMPLTTSTECVDDTASVHYNEVVERTAVARVDWNSSERMRQVKQYRLGAIIDYNAAPRVPGRGSCIFFHIWGGPRAPTVGCTALDAGELERFLAWLDPKARPVVVQVPLAVYRRVRADWQLPPLER